MSTDYIVSSLPALRFGESAPISNERLQEMCGGELPVTEKWRDLETQLKNALVEARAARSGKAVSAEKYRRVAEGCSLYWKNRMLEAYKTEDVAKRDEAIDRVFWDAAGELTEPGNPLGKGALATYSVRLDIAIRRSKISKEQGNAAFDRLTEKTEKKQ